MHLIADCWDRVLGAMTYADRAILVGPPGTGKTFASLKLGVKPDQKVYAVTLDNGTMVHEIRGTTILTKNSQIWQDATGTLAARQGARLVLNEIDRASEEVLGFLYGLCDWQETAMFTLPTGEIVTPAPGFTVIATMNGDVDALPEGIQSRFPVRVYVDEIADGALNALPAHMREAAKAMFAAEQGRRGTIREWQAVAAMQAQGASTDMALALVFGETARDVKDSLLAAGMDV